MIPAYTIKRGVSLVMTAEIEKMLTIVCRVFNTVKLPVVITSGLEGLHSENSLHYKFRAFDLRKIFDNSELSETWTIHREYILFALRDQFKARNYPVEIVDETDHIHIEWDDGGKA